MRRTRVERDLPPVTAGYRRRLYPRMMEAIFGTDSRSRPGTASIYAPTTRQSRATLEKNVWNIARIPRPE